MAWLVGLASGLSLHPTRIATSFAFIPYGEINARRIVLPVLPVGWTLNMEMFFYTIFTLVLFLPRYRMVALSCVLGGLVLAGLVFRPTGLACGLDPCPDAGIRRGRLARPGLGQARVAAADRSGP